MLKFNNFYIELCRSKAILSVENFYYALFSGFKKKEFSLIDLKPIEI